MRFLALALCLMSSIAWCEAQNRDRTNADDDSGWQYWYGLVADDEDMESGQAEDVYDMLAELATDKINLNRATREDLERIYRPLWPRALARRAGHGAVNRCHAPPTARLFCVCW